MNQLQRLRLNLLITALNHGACLGCAIDAAAEFEDYVLHGEPDAADPGE